MHMQISILALMIRTSILDHCIDFANSMAKVGLLLCLLLVSTGFNFSVADAQSCKACNCQFSNVQVLSRLVEAEVNRTLADTVNRRVSDEVNRKLADEPRKTT